MCLIISKVYHKEDNNRNVKCFVAKEDILAYKCLDYKNGKYYTPFQYMHIVFTKGKYIYTNVYMKKKTFCKMDEGGYVWSGIHAYRTMSRAFAVSSFYEFDGTYMHYAVIPKGSNFYIGNNGDIVSNNLIVYREKRCFDRHYPSIIDFKQYIDKYLKEE